MDYAPINLPALPSFNDLAGGLKTDADYGNIVNVIKRAGAQPGLTASVMPSISNILSPDGQAASPYAAAIRASTASNVSGAQSDAMRRGLTGSDIEGANMNAARATGENSMAQLYGQTANQYASMIMQAATGDINNNRELLMTLAEAMGQELTSQRDMEMFRKSLQFSIDQANSAARAKKNGAIAGAVGGLVGGGAGLFFSGGNPAAGQMGMGMGQSAGGGIGAMF